MLGKQVHYKGGQPLLEGLPQTWAFLQVHSAGYSLAALEPTSHRSLHRGNLCRISALCWSLRSLGSGCCIFHNFSPGQPQFSASHIGSALLPSFVSKIIKWKWIGTQWTVETYKWSYVHGGLTLKPSPEPVNRLRSSCLPSFEIRNYLPTHLFSGFTFQGWISTAYAKARGRTWRWTGQVGLQSLTTLWFMKTALHNYRRSASY